MNVDRDFVVTVHPLAKKFVVQARHRNDAIKAARAALRERGQNMAKLQFRAQAKEPTPIFGIEREHKGLKDYGREWKAIRDSRLFNGSYVPRPGVFE